MLNVITIMGRLVRDPELRQAKEQRVCNFTLACDRPGGRDAQTDFIDCVAWNKTAEVVRDYCVKGDPIVVSGRLQSRRWEDSSGAKRTNWEIQVNSIEFCGSRRKEEAAPTAKEDDELPF